MQKYDTCQIFTPEKVAEYMLELASLDENIFSKRILENSFGEGVFLKSIINEYIRIGREIGLSNSEIALKIENNLYGYEIDERYYNQTLLELNEILNDNDIVNVKWNLFLKDSLMDDLKIKFDIVIGNPPYIKYSRLSSENRALIKSKYESCREGKPDYYYAFIEDAITRLEDKGILVYLIPSGIYKNTHAEKLREIVKKGLVKIIDYRDKRLFLRKNSKTVYMSVTSTIIMFEKGSDFKNIEYLDISKKQIKSKNIDKNTLNGPWVFNNTPRRKNRFGDFFDVQISVATQLNKAFVINKPYTKLDNHYKIGSFYIEDHFIRDAGKPNSLRSNKEEKIIFPYVIDQENQLNRIENIEQYPGLLSYLNQFKEKLELRKHDENAHWFEYGRSQAINNIIGQSKIVMSTIITNRVHCYLLDENSVPYSGIFISEKSNEYSLNEAIEILRSQEFLDYAMSVGILVDGNSVRIKVIDIKNYMF